MKVKDAIAELHNQHFLVEMDEEESANPSGPIIAPERYREEQRIGTIVMAAEDTPEHLVVGTRVIVSRFAGRDFKLEGAATGPANIKLCSPLDVVMRLIGT